MYSRSCTPVVSVALHLFFVRVDMLTDFRRCSKVLGSSVAGGSSGGSGYSGGAAAVLCMRLPTQRRVLAGAFVAHDEMDSKLPMVGNSDGCSHLCALASSGGFSAACS